MLAVFYGTGANGKTTLLEAVMHALGLYREQAYPDHGGHQPISHEFEG